MFRSTLVACLMLCSSLATAGDSVKQFPLPNHGSLELRVPAGWADDVRQAPGDLPPTISFKSQNAPPFEVILTPMWKLRPDMKMPGPPEMRSSVEKAANEAASQAVEQSIEVKEMTGKAGVGYYFSATDKAPKPGEYKYMTQGMIGVKDMVVLFTVLTNDGQESTAKKALSMLASATHH
jgi:hypothetical protein